MPPTRDAILLEDRSDDDDDDIAGGNLTAASLRAAMAAEEATNTVVRVPATLKPYVYTTDHDTDACKRSVAMNFFVLKKIPRHAFAMAIGVATIGIDSMLKEFPFDTKARTQKDYFDVKNEDLQLEVSRRGHFLGKEDKTRLENQGAVIPKQRPQPKAWPRTKLQNWLRVHVLPLEPKDREFLVWKISEVKRDLISQRSARKTIESNDISYWERAGGQNLAHRCRLVEVITDEEFREVFMGRDNIASHRTVLDARNTASQPISNWQILADAFNDRNRNYSSKILGDAWGKWFKDSMNLDWQELDKNNCHPVADGLAMKRMFQQINNDVGAAASKWEQSGNGEGLPKYEAGEGGIPDADEFKTRGGDRLAFLQSRHPVTMYCWYTLIAVDLYRTASTEFEKDDQVDGNNCASVAGLSVGSMSDDCSSKKRPNRELEAVFKQLRETQDTMVGELQRSTMVTRLNTVGQKVLGLQAKFGEAQKDARMQKLALNDFEFKAAFGGNSDPRVLALIESMRVEWQEAKGLAASQIGKLKEAEDEYNRLEEMVREGDKLDKTPRKSNVVNHGRAVSVRPLSYRGTDHGLVNTVPPSSKRPPARENTDERNTFSPGIKRYADDGSIGGDDEDDDDDGLEIKSISPRTEQAKRAKRAAKRAQEPQSDADSESD
jgi:hypothetical protein